jgi:hypothetical protein
MKIPTILGLALIITTVSLGIVLLYSQNKAAGEEKTRIEPKEIQVLNISDTQATVIWQTNSPAIGRIAYGTSSSLDNTASDNRDRTSVQEHQIHFVTLRQLNPETTYYYKVLSNGHSFPSEFKSFKTAKKLAEKLENKPIRGSVLNINLNPIDEALVFLEIDNAQEFATFTSTAGNFILPLTQLRTQDLAYPFSINSNTQAKLIIKKGNLTSEVNLTLPLPNNQLLPPLVIGQNIDLKDLITHSTTEAKPLDQTSSPKENKFDLNSDNKTNSLDLAIVLDHFGQSVGNNAEEQLKKSDLNGDAKIDQKDIDLLTLNL